jgi:CheY-like chemotaxis protein
MTREAPTVILVQDKSPDPYSVRQWLETNGCRVIETTSTSEAIEAASDFTRRDRPDLILFDLSPSPRDRLRLVRLLREEMLPSHVLIVGLSESTDETSPRDARDAGCDELFTKPVDVKQLTGLLGDLRHGSGWAG